MTELEPWPVIRAQHRPTFVSLRDNRISRFTNILQWQFDCNSTRVYQTQFDFHGNNIEHITDIINGWNIDGQLLHRSIIVNIILMLNLNLNFEYSCSKDHLVKKF